MQVPEELRGVIVRQGGADHRQRLRSQRRVVLPHPEHGERDRPARVLRAGRDGDEVRSRALGHGQSGSEQPVLAGEVVVDQGDIDVGPIGDRPHRGALEPEVGEQRPSRLKDRGAGVAAPGARSSGPTRRAAEASGGHGLKIPAAGADLNKC